MKKKITTEKFQFHYDIFFNDFNNTKNVMVFLPVRIRFLYFFRKQYQNIKSPFQKKKKKNWNAVVDPSRYFINGLDCVYPAHPIKI